MKNKSFVSLVAIVAIFVGSFLYFKKNAQPPVSSPQAQSHEAGAGSFRVTPVEVDALVKSHSPVKGPFSAKVTLVEFLDPECEACAYMYPYVKKLEKEFEKDLKIVIRYMPFHGNSKYVANILEGARAESKYWETLELLFTTQEKWGNHHNPRPELLPEILKPLGLNLDKILADARAGKYDQQINDDFEDGKKIGVRATPTFFINGKKLEELGYESLRAMIQQEISNN